ncbi:MAG: hypothetical protein KF764_03100 [Labilithrix sp.]|nr:hypothetical protein [Labilithrix sp.]
MNIRKFGRPHPALHHRSVKTDRDDYDAYVVGHGDNAGKWLYVIVQPMWLEPLREQQVRAAWLYPLTSPTTGRKIDDLIGEAVRAYEAVHPAATTRTAWDRIGEPSTADR